MNDYKQELIETLRKASTCMEKLNGGDCCNCKYYYMELDDIHCPSGLSCAEAQKRLEELCNEKS